MDEALRAKFPQGSEMARRLLEDTGDYTLVEQVNEFVSLLYFAFYLCSSCKKRPGVE